MLLITSSAVLFTISTIVLIGWIYIFINKKDNSVCPPIIPCVINNKIIPELDLQFSENNLPTNVYQDVFSGPNVWVGGYNSAMNAGRTVVTHQKS